MTALKVSELSKTFPVGGGLFRKAGAVRAVRPVSFAVETGETLGIVGESGCGKSTLARMLVGLIDPTTGHIEIEGKPLDNADPAAFGRLIQYVFQDPVSSLNPRKTVLELVGEPLLIHDRLPLAERRERVAALLEDVGLAADAMTRYPHQFSGGQRQRLCIARALSLNPKLIIADESVSALDVSVQAQVLELLERLRETHGLSYLFISHDLAVVERIFTGWR